MKATTHGILVINPAAELLLCHSTGNRHWDIPKGMPDEGESSAATALREAREECGLLLETTVLLDLGRFDYRPDKALALHAVLIERIDASLCVCTSTFEDRWGRLRPEMDDFRWTAFDEISQYVARNMARVLTTSLTLAAVFAQLASLGPPAAVRAISSG